MTEKEAVKGGHTVIKFVRIEFDDAWEQFPPKDGCITYHVWLASGVVEVTPEDCKKQGNTKKDCKEKEGCKGQAYVYKKCTNIYVFGDVVHLPWVEEEGIAD